MSQRETQTLIAENRESIDENRESIARIMRAIDRLVEYRDETEDIMRHERRKTDAANSASARWTD